MTRERSQALDEVLWGLMGAAVQAARAEAGLVVGVVDGVSVPLTTTGSGNGRRLLGNVADAAVAARSGVRRTGEDRTTAAAAECLLAGEQVVGAIAVAGPLDVLQPDALGAYAEVAARLLGGRASSAPVTAMLDELAAIGADLDLATLLVRLFDAVEDLFAASGGFCALFDGDRLRIPASRGVDREALQEATRHPGFRAFLAAPQLRVDPPSHPVVNVLTGGQAGAVGLPLVAGGVRLGHLVLLVDEPPDPARRTVLTSFAHHVALAVRAALVHERAADREEQLASVVHAAHGPVLVVDDRGRLLLANGAAAQLFGLAVPFDTGRDLRGRLGADALEALLDDGADASPSTPVEVTVGSGLVRTYRASAQRMLSSSGRLLGRVISLHDITTERETDQVKADFVSVIGHELRTPLTVIRGYVRTLATRGDALDAELQSQALEAIGHNAERLQHLIEDLLFVSAVESTRVVLHLQRVDLAALVDGFARDRVSVRRPPRRIVRVMDRLKVEQVLRHLLDNALKYSDGEVVLEMAPGPEGIEFAVVDSGPGIFSGDIPRLFERFVQLDGGSTRRHGGTGLGLYLCRKLVEAHGGRIWCESRLGAGSRFTFVIPPQDDEYEVEPPAREPVDIERT